MGPHVRSFMSISGDLPYWTGQNFQESKEVMVRVRAWKMASLPAPDFVNTSIHVQTRTGNCKFVCSLFVCVFLKFLSLNKLLLENERSNSLVIFLPT